MEFLGISLDNFRFVAFFEWFWKAFALKSA